MFMDEILTFLFFLTNVTNKKVVKTCFMISNLSFGLANVFTHVAAKQQILMFIISMSLQFLNWCTFKLALITLNQLVRFTAISYISIQLSLSWRWVITITTIEHFTLMFFHVVFEASLVRPNIWTNGAHGLTTLVLCFNVSLKIKWPYRWEVTQFTFDSFLPVIESKMLMFRFWISCFIVTFCTLDVAFLDEFPNPSMQWTSYHKCHKQSFQHCGSSASYANGGNIP